MYIATQGPIVSTVADFWRMVWQEHAPIIVMITNIEEMNEVGCLPRPQVLLLRAPHCTSMDLGAFTPLLR